MSKKIQTVQFSDKNEFDKNINEYLNTGWKLVDGGYTVIEQNGEIIYSQVLCLDDDVEVNYHHNKLIQSIYELNSKGEREGKFTIWSTEGQKIKQGSIKHGLRCGKYKVWYDDGKPLVVGEYLPNYKEENDYSDHSLNHGVKYGLWKEYYPDGQKKLECTYSGNFFYYVINGYHLSIDEGYRVSIPIGKVTSWYNNGQLERISFFDDIVDAHNEVVTSAINTKKVIIRNQKSYDKTDEEESVLEQEIEEIHLQDNSPIKHYIVGWKKDYDLYYKGIISKETKYSENIREPDNWEDSRELERHDYTYNLFSKAKKLKGPYKKYSIIKNWYKSVLNEDKYKEKNIWYNKDGFGPELTSTHLHNEIGPFGAESPYGWVVAEIRTYYDSGEIKSIDSFNLTYDLWTTYYVGLIASTTTIQIVIESILKLLSGEIPEETLRYGVQEKYDENGEIYFKKDWNTPYEVW